MFRSPIREAYNRYISENGGIHRLTYLTVREVPKGEVTFVVMGPHGPLDALRVLFGRFKLKTYYAHEHDGKIITSIKE